MTCPLTSRRVDDLDLAIIRADIDPDNATRLRSADAARPLQELASNMVRQLAARPQRFFLSACRR
jgi:hypothetical protein